MKEKLPTRSAQLLETLGVETTEAVQFPHLTLMRFEATQYELTYAQKFAFWVLFSKENGYIFLPLDQFKPGKSFDDFISLWVNTHDSNE